MRTNKAKITEKGDSQKGVLMIFTCIFSYEVVQIPAGVGWKMAFPGQRATVEERETSGYSGT